MSKYLILLLVFSLNSVALLTVAVADDEKSEPIAFNISSIHLNGANGKTLALPPSMHKTTTRFLNVIKGKIRTHHLKGNTLKKRFVKIQKPKHPLIFSRFLYKYSLFNNYYNWWIDRPLLHDRSLRYPSGTFKHIIKKSLIRDGGIAESYGLDGWEVFINMNQGDHFKSSTKYLESGKVGAFKFLSSFDGHGMKPNNIRECIDSLKTAQRRSSVFRLGGRILISSYCAGLLTPSELNSFLDSLRKQANCDFLFVVDLQHIIHKIIRNYPDGKLPKETTVSLKNIIRSYLDICDGVMYAGANHLSIPRSNGYGKIFNPEQYKSIISIFEDVLNESKYNNKLFGLSASLGYINHRAGTAEIEEGTKRLRQTLEIVSKAKPDFIILPEWNEVNENTCFQPTVYNSFAVKRILRYYISQLKKTPLTPIPGDDLSVPNLIISYPRSVKLGEKIDFEILNVPDGKFNSDYKVNLQLFDVNRKLLKEFRNLSFSPEKLQDRTISIASEQMCRYQVVVPVVTILTGSGPSKIYDNLLYVKINSTWNYIYQTVKQPIRDLFSPEIADLQTVNINNKSHTVSFQGNLKTNKILSAVELLEDGVEAYSYDRKKEFDRSKNVIIMFDAYSFHKKKLKGRIDVNNVSNFYFRPMEHANKNFTGYSIDKNGVSFNQSINRNYRSFLFTLPRKDIQQAVFKCDLMGESFKIPGKDLLRNQYRKIYADQTVVGARELTTSPDIPVRINAKSVVFSYTAYPETPTPIYHIRAITNSGKIYRSWPQAPFPQLLDENVDLNVFSDTMHSQVIQVKVPKAKILDINYDFTEHTTVGDQLSTSAGRRWYAQLGGGINYGEPFNRDSHYPKRAKDCRPTWVRENGRDCLEFDGIGNYIVLPQNSMPIGSFTLSFEIKPASDHNMVLFRHHGHTVGSLTLRRNKRFLDAVFVDNKIKTTFFKTGLPLPEDQWSKITVSYNLLKVTFEVNGVSKSFPFSKRALQSWPSIFGAHTRPGFGVEKQENMSYFRGRLRSLRIKHSSQ